MTRALPILAALLALPGVAFAEDETAPPVTVDLRADPTTAFVGQPVQIWLTIGYEQEWLAQKGTFLTAGRVRFRCDPIPGVPLRGAEVPGDRLRIAVGEEIVDATPSGIACGDEHSWNLVPLEGRFVPREPGLITFPAPVVRYAEAERFEPDVLGTRVPVGVRFLESRGEPLTLRVLPLPAEGRPDDFQGLVGKFTLRATVADDESLRLTLVLEGEGNLDSAPAPRIAPTGFHVLGVLEDLSPTRAAYTYDLRPLASDLREIPSVAVPTFDPGPPARYEVLRTDPIPIAVRLPPAPPPPPAPPSPFPVLPVVTGAAVLALAAWILLARRRRRPVAAPPSRIDEAVAALRLAASDPGADLAPALAEVLAARLGCPAAAVVSPDLARRLEASGLPAEIASRATRLLDRLLASRYGGPPDPSAPAAVRSLLSDLERLPATP